jgi:hypothetical protein
MHLAEFWEGVERGIMIPSYDAGAPGGSLEITGINGADIDQA